MSAEANEVALARIVDELLNGQDLDVLDELVHPDYVDGYGGFGRDQYRELLLQTFAVFPDMFLTVEDVVGEGDVVVGRFTLRGTHLGEFLGLEPTGKRIEFAANGWLEFSLSEDGRPLEPLGRLRPPRAASRPVVNRSRRVIEHALLS